MAILTLLVFCLGVIFGSGAFFRKGGETLMTYVLFPIGFLAMMMSFQAENTEVYVAQITRTAILGAVLGGMLSIATILFRLRLAGKLSLAGFTNGTLPLWQINLKSLLTAPGRRNKTAFANARNASTIYYHTAVKLGALTSAIDRTRTIEGFASLKATFNLNRTNCPDAMELFNSQIRTPQRLAAILKPFITQYGRNSTIGETLIFGMCKVALVDGSVSLAEIRLIDSAASTLGIHPMDTRRIIASAGIEIVDEFSHDQAGWQERMRRGAQSGTQSGGHRSERSNDFGSSRAAPNERAAHLATLGLPATATLAHAKKAWRKLATKYHPDKLVSQNLPDDEMAKAEAMMQAINEAYDWLKDHG